MLKCWNALVIRNCWQVQTLERWKLELLKCWDVETWNCWTCWDAASLKCWTVEMMTCWKCWHLQNDVDSELMKVVVARYPANRRTFGAATGQPRAGITERPHGAATEVSKTKPKARHTIHLKKQAELRISCLWNIAC